MSLSPGENTKQSKILKENFLFPNNIENKTAFQVGTHFKKKSSDSHIFLSCLPFPSNFCVSPCAVYVGQWVKRHWINSWFVFQIGEKIPNKGVSHHAVNLDE